MNILEKEIQKRQEIVDNFENKLNQIAEKELELEQLKKEIENVDVDVLKAEIEEIKTYLPHNEEAVVIEDTVCAEIEQPTEIQ